MGPGGRARAYRTCCSGGRRVGPCPRLSRARPVCACFAPPGPPPAPRAGSTCGEGPAAGRRLGLAFAARFGPLKTNESRSDGDAGRPCGCGSCVLRARCLHVLACGLASLPSLPAVQNPLSPPLACSLARPPPGPPPPYPPPSVPSPASLCGSRGVTTRKTQRVESCPNCRSPALFPGLRFRFQPGRASRCPAGVLPPGAGRRGPAWCPGTTGQSRLGPPVQTLPRPVLVLGPDVTRASRGCHDSEGHDALPGSAAWWRVKNH